MDELKIHHHKSGGWQGWGFRPATQMVDHVDIFMVPKPN